MYIVIIHVASLALAVLGVIRAGDRAQVLVYAFILEYALRLATVFAITRALAIGDSSLLARLAPIFCRLPTGAAESQPIRYEGPESRNALAFRWYVATVADFKTAVGSLTIVLVVSAYFYFAALILLIGIEADELVRRRAQGQADETRRAG